MYFRYEPLFLLFSFYSAEELSKELSLSYEVCFTKRNAEMQVDYDRRYLSKRGSEFILTSLSEFSEKISLQSYGSVLSYIKRFN